MAETLKHLSENARNLAEGSEISDEELSRIWSNLTTPETNEQFKASAAAASEHMLPEMMPLIQNMMQSLLSKDILYPALKDLIVKVSCHSKVTYLNLISLFFLIAVP